MAQITPESVLDFWYGKGFDESYKTLWFPDDGSEAQNHADQIITEAFSDLLSTAESGALDHWKDNPRSALALILALDQFSRHIYRHEPRENIDNATAKALQVANHVLGRGWDKSYTIEEFVFALMPLRHTPTIERLNDVMYRVKERSKLDEHRNILLDKFTRATLRRLQVLEGKSGDPSDILEFHPFEADESIILKEKLVKTVEGFLIENNAQNFKYMMTSLSGGVDSMVLTKILLKLSHKFHNYKIIACHVDYGNRPESGAEADFVEGWCAELGIEFRKRRIDEIKRGHTPRDEYERISREVRYNLYKQSMAEVDNDVPAVMVGHHKGDVQENVISNMMKGCSMLELAGMYPKSVVNGVMIWRPMLTHPKSDIFDFAHKYGIPYFKDTTPKWSTRGKLRNQLLPLLADIYGSGFPQHLSNAAADSEQLNVMVYESVMKPFWDEIRHTPIGVSFDCEPHLHRPILFWKESFKHICHHMMGIGLISERPISMLLSTIRPQDDIQPEYLNNRKKTIGWINMKGTNKTYLSGTQLYIFEAAFFPEVPYFTPKMRVEIGQQYTFGPWKLLLSFDSGTKTEEYAPFTLDDIWGGEISYTLPSHHDGYIVDSDERPKIFRQLDKKITNPIPIARCVQLKPRPHPHGDMVRVSLIFTTPLKSGSANSDHL